MTEIIIGIVGTILWIVYEMWRSPLMEETPTGFKTIRPAKKLKDLFKKKSSAGTISDLEKLGRGRSKH